MITQPFLDLVALIYLSGFFDYHRIMLETYLAYGFGHLEIHSCTLDSHFIYLN